MGWRRGPSAKRHEWGGWRPIIFPRVHRSEPPPPVLHYLTRTVLSSPCLTASPSHRGCEAPGGRGGTAGGRSAWCLEGGPSAHTGTPWFLDLLSPLDGTVNIAPLGRTAISLPIRSQVDSSCCRGRRQACSLGRQHGRAARRHPSLPSAKWEQVRVSLLLSSAPGSPLPVTQISVGAGGEWERTEVQRTEGGPVGSC